MIKFETYLESLDNNTIIKMYELIFKNPISNYIEMDRSQMIEEILYELTSYEVNDFDFYNDFNNNLNR